MLKVFIHITLKPLFLFLVVQGFELRTLCCAMPPALFTLVIFETDSCFLPRQGFPPLDMNHHTQLFSMEMGSPQSPLHPAPRPAWNHHPPDPSHLHSLGWQVWATAPRLWLRWGYEMPARLASNWAPNLPNSASQVSRIIYMWATNAQLQSIFKAPKYK
jgi:hypothetical protein